MTNKDFNEFEFEKRIRKIIKKDYSKYGIEFMPGRKLPKETREEYGFKGRISGGDVVFWAMNPATGMAKEIAIYFWHKRDAIKLVNKTKLLFKDLKREDGR